MDIYIANKRGSWAIADALSKDRARLVEHENGYYSFVSRSDRTTLVAGSGKTERPTLRSVYEAGVLLNDCLTGCFSDLADNKSPRLAVRITMVQARPQSPYSISNNISHKSTVRILRSIFHAMTWLMNGNKVWTASMPE